MPKRAFAVGSVKISRSRSRVDQARAIRETRPETRRGRTRVEACLRATGIGRIDRDARVVRVAAVVSWAQEHASVPIARVRVRNPPSSRCARAPRARGKRTVDGKTLKFLSRAVLTTARSRPGNGSVRGARTPARTCLDLSASSLPSTSHASPRAVSVTGTRVSSSTLASPLSAGDGWWWSSGTSPGETPGSFRGAGAIVGATAQMRCGSRTNRLDARSECRRAIARASRARACVGASNTARTRHLRRWTSFFPQIGAFPPRSAQHISKSGTESRC